MLFAFCFSWAEIGCKEHNCLSQIEDELHESVKGNSMFFAGNSSNLCSNQMVQDLILTLDMK